VYVFAKEYFHPFNPTPLKYKPLIVIGPSVLAKTLLINAILAKYGGLFERKLSYTTRQRKTYEKALNNYHLITKEEFMRVSLVFLFIVFYWALDLSECLLFIES